MSKLYVGTLQKLHHEINLEILEQLFKKIDWFLLTSGEEVVATETFAHPPLTFRR